MSVANQSYGDITERRKGCHLHCGHRYGQNTDLLDAPLFRSGGIQIVVTSLNLLGKQNIASLARVGI